jgi:hypothetical protein
MFHNSRAVLLLNSTEGVGFDISLDALPFEEISGRAATSAFHSGHARLEDLLVLKLSLRVRWTCAMRRALPSGKGGSSTGSSSWLTFALQPDATVAALKAYSSTRSQPMIQAASSPSVA